MSGDIDLSELQLLPQWAKEPLQHNPYQNYEGESASPRDRRGGRDDRGRGGPARRPDSRGRDTQRPPQNRGPRPEGGRGAGPRPSGPRRDSGGFGGKPGFRSQRDDRQREERPPEILPHLEVHFQPEPHGAESMVKQIKSSGRAYPVFELARMILKKPERHQVLLQVPLNKDTPPADQLFVCKIDQSLWLSEADAVQHLLRKHLQSFYQAERVAIDPPKGNFSSIGVCGMSGAVLGPPNHHDYPVALRRLYLERFSDMPFEAFKSRVQLVKDEAVLAKWKDQQSWKTEYVVKGEGQPAPETQPTEAVEAIETAPQAVEIVEPATTTEEPAATEMATTETVEQTETPAAEATEVSAPAPTDTAVRLPNLEAVRAHFTAQYQPTQIKAVTSWVLGDMKTRQQSDFLIQKVIRRAWDSEVRFPAKTGPALIHSLSKNGLQFFKWNKGITHVAAVRPKRFDPAKSPVAQGVSNILDWVSAHPGKNRMDLLKALAPEVEAPVAPATPVPPTTETISTVGTTPAPATAPVPEPAALEVAQPNASAVLSDLHWLLHEGYIVEFANNQLDLLRQNEKTAPVPAKANLPAAKDAAPSVAADPAPEVENPVEPVDIGEDPAQA